MARNLLIENRILMAKSPASRYQTKQAEDTGSNKGGEHG